MATKLNAYISFRNNAKEAMEFYQAAFGGKLDLSTFKEGGMGQNEGDANLIMHAMLTAENGIVFMASDTPSSMEYKPGTNMSMALSGDNEAELKGYWEKLSMGGNITMPMNKAPWGDQFGMFTDKFGISWMVNIALKK